MKPERIENLPFHEYQKLEGVNQTTLKQLLLSPAHYRAALTAEHKDTPAMRLGRLVHDLALGVADFSDGAFRIASQNLKRTKKKEWALFEESTARAFPHAELVTHEEYKEAMRILRGLLFNDGVNGALSRCSDANCELSIRWQDEETGIICKARLDMVCDDAPLILDLKTTNDASPAAFSKTIANFGLHIQAAFYCMGVDALSAWPNIPHRFGFLAVEKKPPYLAAYYALKDAALDEGKSIVRELLAELKHCREEETWPGYPEEAQVIDLPPWGYERR